MFFAFIDRIPPLVLLWLPVLSIFFLHLLGLPCRLNEGLELGRGFNLLLPGGVDVNHGRLNIRVTHEFRQYRQLRSGLGMPRAVRMPESIYREGVIGEVVFDDLLVRLLEGGKG